MKKTVAWLLVACGLVFCAGCLGPNTAGIALEHGRLEVEDNSFATRVEMVREKTTRTDQGFLKVQVTLKNTQQRDARFLYRFIWKDRDGMTLKQAETLWKTLHLHGREEVDVEAICPVPRGADFRLVVRPDVNF